MKYCITLFITLLGLAAITYAQPFRSIVAIDGTGSYTSVQSAIDACPDNERSIIFIKNGIYNEQISIGSKGVSSKKIISLIGESADGVIITSSGFRNSNDPNNTNTVYDIVTVQIYANDFYAENITIANTASKDVTVGQAEALYSASDRQTFKNCRFLGHQDTYKSNSAVRCYLKDCFVEGTVDFIYDGGVIFFDDCTINCVRGNGYITAPSTGLTIPKSLTANEIFLRYGFFFRNCAITASDGVASNSFYLGRPWGERAGSFFINCRMDKHIKAEGWQTWDGNETTATFGEYNSLDIDGNSLNVSGRVSWSLQLAQQDVENILTPTFIYNRANPSLLYDPLAVCTAPYAPTSLVDNNKTLTWSAVDGAIGYVVYKDGNYLTSTSELIFTYTEAGTYTVKSVSSTGALSPAKEIGTGISTIENRPVKVSVSNGNICLSENSSIEIYSIVGTKINASKTSAKTFNIQMLPVGIYIVKGRTFSGKDFCQKIRIEN